MSERRDLVIKNNKKGYVIGILILLTLSVVGIWWLKKDQKPTIVNKVEGVTESLLPSPMAEATPIEIITPTEIPNGNLRSEEDGFIVSFSPDRKLYEIKESSGNRYTLYRNDSTITIHAGGKWSWVHPGREFNSSLLVASKPTFVYQTTDQKLVDLENGTMRYTIQCVHNGLSAAKVECEQFLGDFRLL